jgi:pimeloyl-ACP methyl ester carboxylesterase
MVQATVRKTILDVGGVPLVTREAGRGAMLLYLHDELSTAWCPFLDHLSQRFHVLASELPGYGDTERPEWIESVDDVAFLVADLAEAIGMGNPIAVAGSGLGAWMALEAAVRGARFSRLLLMGCPGMPIPGDPPADYFFLTPEERATLFFEDPTAAPAVGEDHVVRNEAMTARLAWQPRYVSPKLTHRLNRVAQPTLVAWGAADRFLSLAHGQALADGLPNAKLAIMDGAGHFPALDRPEAMARVAADFLSGTSSNGNLR